MRICIKNPTPESVYETLKYICNYYKKELTTINLYFALHDEEAYYDFFDINDNQAYIRATDNLFSDMSISCFDDGIEQDGTMNYISVRELIHRRKKSPK